VADAEFTELFGRAGGQGWLCVREVDGDGEVAYRADEPVAAASVFKIVVALEVYRQVSAGELDPAEPVRVRPRQRTPGPTGLSVFADEAELSVRDLVTMMLTVSDNAATDVLIDRVGLDRVRATLDELGLPGTVIPAPLRDELDIIGRDAGFAGWADLEQSAAGLSADEEQRVQQRMLASSALDPRRAIRTTARETATLLRLIWRDEAGPAAACAPVRQAMARQVTRQRLATGFERHGFAVAAKSGTLLGVIRNEAGVIRLPDGRRYAAAVFTRADRQWEREHEINAVIGAAAARAVGRLAAGGLG
jgi:beta-lactamase class A